MEKKERGEQPPAKREKESNRTCEKSERVFKKYILKGILSRIEPRKPWTYHNGLF